MNRRTVMWIVIGACSVIALVIALAVVLMQTGIVTVQSNLSSGEADDSFDNSHRIGYVGITVPGKTTAGAMIRSDLDRIGGPPLLLLPGGTRVKVIDADAVAARVTILEGRSKGQEPWLHWKDIQ